MAASTVTVHVVRILAVELAVIVLANPLFDDSSYFAAGLSTVNENINVSQSNTSFEVELYVRDSSCLILDVLFLAMFHIHII